MQSNHSNRIQKKKEEKKKEAQAAREKNQLPQTAEGSGGVTIDYKQI